MVKNYSFSQINVAYLANGLQLALPVHTLHGEKAGPTLGITAAVHGDEIIGTEILRRCIEILKREEIAGTIKIIPVANPLAFEDLARNTPIDRSNLNRVFPGNPNGMLTDIIAHKIAERFLSGLDYYVDLHSGGADPIVDYVYWLNDETLSRSFGSKILYTPRPGNKYGGTTATVTVELGIPTTVVEVGGGPNSPRYIDKGINGLLNQLRHLKMISGEMQKPEKQVVVDHIENIAPHHGGLLVPEFGFDKMNEIIEGKVILARIYNPMTLELLEEIRAPFEKNLMILMRGSLNRVHAGDYSFMIADADNAK